MTMTDAQEERNSSPRRRAGLRWILLTFAVLLAIIVPFVLLEEQITAWTTAAFEAARGQPWLGGGIILALLAGDVVLPVPSSVVSAFAGALLGWKLAALVIWSGMTIGCALGYWLGASAGRGVAMRVVGAGELDRARRLFDNIGPVALIITRAVPVLAEAGTLAAGAAGMPFWMFMLATTVANIGVALAYAGIGAAAVSSGSFLIAFIGLAAVPALAWTVWRFVARRRSRPES
jgi:uncharacterized membrane protein YdjX (TVP38/TMEM64 family)